MLLICFTLCANDVIRNAKEAHTQRAISNHKLVGKQLSPNLEVIVDTHEVQLTMSFVKQFPKQNVELVLDSEGSVEAYREFLDEENRFIQEVVKNNKTIFSIKRTELNDENIIFTEVFADMLLDIMEEKSKSIQLDVRLTSLIENREDVTIEMEGGLLYKEYINNMGWFVQELMNEDKVILYIKREL